MKHTRSMNFRGHADAPTRKGAAFRSNSRPGGGMLRIAVYFALAAMVQFPAVPQEAVPQDAPQQQRAEDSAPSLLDDFLVRIRNATHLQFSARSTTTHNSPGSCTTEVVDFDFAWKQGCLTMTMGMEGETLRAVIGGDQLLMALDSKREYVLTAPPKDLGTFVGWLTNEPLLKQFFRSPPFDAVKRLYTVHSHTETGAGGTCYELALAGTDLHVFLDRDAQGRARLCRAVADTSRGSNNPVGTHVTELVFTPGLPSATEPPCQFDLTPPDGFSLVEWFSTSTGPSSPQVRSLNTLSGVALPPFDLERLQGGRAVFSELRGKQVILLEFWATWCRPCRTTLKILDGLKARFGDRLHTLAVNVMEPREKVAAFQQRMDMKSDIALDADGFLAAELGVEFYPCVILIGLDGTIQAVHIGTDKSLEEMLAGQIEQLIAGEDLIEGATRHSAKERLHYRMALNATEYCNAFVNY
jgi:thiol-disulfide isomerase/thioredoxin